MSQDANSSTIVDGSIDQAHLSDSDSIQQTNFVVATSVPFEVVPIKTPSKISALKKTKPKKSDSIESDSIESILVDDVTQNSVPAEGFVGLNLGREVNEAIGKAGYDTPTPIQSETVPHVLAGMDVIGQAETGSGKTAAFAWPLLSKIDFSLRSPQVLVLTPTRELAIQVTGFFEKYGSCFDGFGALSIYGGQSYETQLRGLRKGVHVVVGTPGRVMDHMRQGTLDLTNLKTFVLDEADEMLRMGFIDDVEWIMEQLPKPRQILLFSATMPTPIRHIAKVHLNDPVNVSITGESATADSIQQTCVLVTPREKLQTLVQILESEPVDGVIVFVKTRNATILVADQLTQRGLSAAPLNGEIPQNQRERTVDQLKSGRLNILVATDVAARGLDVQRISHVFNFDFPHDTEAYIHRIGRTGRAGRAGAAILFCEPKEQGKLSRLQRATNQKIEKHKQKSIDDINAIRIAGFKQRITDSLADTKQVEFFSKLVSEYQAETETSVEQIAASLAIMAQGDVPLLMKQLARTESNWKKDRPGSGDDRRGGKRSSEEMTTYRIEVGRNHGVGPGNIVGAITNEANLDNTNIGRIQLFDTYSTIDLSASLDQKVLDLLQSVVVSGQQLRISISKSKYSPSDRNRSKKNNGSTSFAKRNSGNSRYAKKDDASAKFAKKEYGSSNYAGKSDDRPRYAKKRDNDSNFVKKEFGSSNFAKKSDDSPRFVKAINDTNNFAKKDDSKPKYVKKADGLAKFGRKPGGLAKFAKKKNDDEGQVTSKKTGNWEGNVNSSDRKPPRNKPMKAKRYVKVRSAN